VFVGSLCALAVFFLSYNLKPLPHHETDKHLSRVASLMAVLVALFPTTSSVAHQSVGSEWVGRVHITCATVLFALLGVLSLFFFTKTSSAGDMTQNKRKRNVVYVVCGITIFAGIVLIGVAYAVDLPASWHSVFYLESLAVIAFGVSWLVKGGVGFSDPPADSEGVAPNADQAPANEAAGVIPD